jgi:chemotaxis protein MotB
MSGHGGGGSERWLVSYADFITLLMVLFVVLYSMGQVDVQRYKQLANSLRAAFSGGPTKIVDPGIDQAGGSEEDKAAAPIVIPGIPQVPVNSVEVAGELTDLLAAANLGGAVSVQNNIEGILISLSEKLVFAPGTAELNQDAYPVLDTISQMILPLENDIRITGHTDDSAPIDPRFPSNWDLSLARAMVIADYFQTAGVEPARLTVAGRGEFKPVFPNDTPEHRALNSRAEIVVVYSVASDLINTNSSLNTIPGVQP